MFEQERILTDPIEMLIDSKRFSCGLIKKLFFLTKDTHKVSHKFTQSIHMFIYYYSRIIQFFFGFCPSLPTWNPLFHQNLSHDPIQGMFTLMARPMRVSPFAGKTLGFMGFLRVSLVDLWDLFGIYGIYLGCMG